MKRFDRLIGLALIISQSSLAAPVLALDYEAKPIKWVLEAPFRSAGALSGGVVCGLVSGRIDGGFHTALKAESHLAGKFGDEKGDLQLLAAAPVALPAGYVLGGIKGIKTGFMHGMKLGWNKPFSRWSYITMEEK